MATWLKGHNKGETAPNRKLPPDDVLRAAYYDEGLTIPEIARRLGVHRKSIHNHFDLRGWPKRKKPAPIDVAPPQLADTPQKIVVRRQGLPHSQSKIVVDLAISLPRIPTLHGHFAASMPSAAGA